MPQQLQILFSYYVVLCQLDHVYSVFCLLSFSAEISLELCFNCLKDLLI